MPYIHLQVVPLVAYQPRVCTWAAWAWALGTHTPGLRDLLPPLRRLLLRAQAGGFPSSPGVGAAAADGGGSPLVRGRAAAGQRMARPLAADLAGRRRRQALSRAALRLRRDGAASRGPGPVGELFGQPSEGVLPRWRAHDVVPMAALTPAAGRQTQAPRHLRTHTHTQTQPTTPTTADEHDLSSNDAHRAAPARIAPGPGAANTSQGIIGDGNEGGRHGAALI